MNLVFSWNIQFCGKDGGSPEVLSNTFLQLSDFWFSFGGRPGQLGKEGSEPKTISHMFEFLVDLVMGPYVCRHLECVCCSLELVFAYGRPGRGTSFSQSWNSAWLCWQVVLIQPYFLSKGKLHSVFTQWSSFSSFISPRGVFMATESNSYGWGIIYTDSSKVTSLDRSQYVNCFQSLVRIIQKPRAFRHFIAIWQLLWNPSRWSSMIFNLVSLNRPIPVEGLLHPQSVAFSAIYLLTMCGRIIVGWTWKLPQQQPQNSVQ